MEKGRIGLITLIMFWKIWTISIGKRFTSLSASDQQKRERNSIRTEKLEFILMEEKVIVVFWIGQDIIQMILVKCICWQCASGDKWESGRRVKSYDKCLCIR